MRLTKTLASAALATLVGTTSIAGGFAPEVVEAPVVIVEPEQPRSTWGVVIPLVAVAALIALAASRDNDNDDDNGDNNEVLNGNGAVATALD